MINKMKKYAIYYGLGGGFGGARFSHIESFYNYDSAMDYAYEYALEEYINYTGLHGLRSYEEIMEEEGVDQFDAEEIMLQDAESWLDYYVKEVLDDQTEEDFE
jgi:hypothetical protein